jgi:hypothetical protein
VKDQSDEGMDSKDVLVLSADPHFVLIAKRMADTRTLETIPTIQSGLAKSALRKRSLITIPYQWDLFFHCFI